MTFAELKREIVVRMAKKMVTSDLQSIQATTTETELIDAIKPIILFLVKNEIIDAGLLAEFTQSNLNAVGIYSTGTHAVTDPDFVLILLDAAVDITVTGQNICEIIHFGTVVSNVNCEDQSFTQLSAYKIGSFDITAIDNSVFVMIAYGAGSHNIQQSTEAISEIHVNDHVHLDLTLNNDSICMLRTFGFSNSIYTQNDTSYIDVSKSDDSIVTENEILP